ncbi:MAG TPA: hypothetical protein VFM59_07275 [Salinimicrobium sp.]|nr:hypothetical protein [Salinimicrobium sp.]
MEIVFTRIAKLTYKDILENLKERWTIKEVRHFIILTEEFLKNIESGQIESPVINKSLNIQKGFVHKNVSLFYIRNQEEQKIYLLTFFDNRMNPETLDRLLNIQKKP